MNLSKFLPKKKNTQDLPAETQDSLSEERIVEEELQERVNEENNAPKVSIEPVKERVVKVNRTIIAGAIVVLCAATGLFVFNPFSSSNTPQQESKAPTVKTNKTEQSSALADLEKAESEKSKNPMNTQKKTNQTVKDGSVHSSAGSRPQTESRSYSSSSSGQSRVYSSAPSRPNQLTEEEKEAAADRKAAKAKAEQKAETREAENLAGFRSDIFFNLPDKSASSGKKDTSSVSVNDYYNNSYNSGADEDYIQVVGDHSARNRRSK